MNAKTAKRIRKTLGYHPTDKRKYVYEDKGNRTIILHPEDPRARYKIAKTQSMVGVNA